MRVVRTVCYAIFFHWIYNLLMESTTLVSSLFDLYQEVIERSFKALLLGILSGAPAAPAQLYYRLTLALIYSTKAFLRIILFFFAGFCWRDYSMAGSSSHDVIGEPTNEEILNVATRTRSSFCGKNEIWNLRSNIHKRARLGEKEFSFNFTEEKGLRASTKSVNEGAREGQHSHDATHDTSQDTFISFIIRCSSRLLSCTTQLNLTQLNSTLVVNNRS